MGTGYKIAAALVLALMGMTFFASFRGWGLRSTTDAQAVKRRRDVRTGSGGYYGRSYYGGGHRYGK